MESEENFPHRSFCQPQRPSALEKANLAQSQPAMILEENQQRDIGVVDLNPGRPWGGQGVKLFL
jgi:hypothetical protein